MENYLELLPENLKTSEMHAYLLSAVAPRPIALASTIDKDGNPNLAPFSYFNVFSTNPPVLIIGPNRSGRTGNNKDTVYNATDVPEIVINIVNYNIVQQTNISSCEYLKGENEFIKAGFTPLKSDLVKPLRVKESPVQLECKVREIIVLGEKGGSGNLILCDIVKIHINKEILNENGQIDIQKIDLVARMGQNFYCRASGSAVFEVEKPNQKLGIGIDQIPEFIKNNPIFNGNDLGKLANISQLPSQEHINLFNQIKSNEFLNSDTSQIFSKVKNLLSLDLPDLEICWLYLMNCK